MRGARRPQHGDFVAGIRLEQPPHLVSRRDGRIRDERDIHQVQNQHHGNGKDEEPKNGKQKTAHGDCSRSELEVDKRTFRRLPQDSDYHNRCHGKEDTPGGGAKSAVARRQITHPKRRDRRQHKGQGHRPRSRAQRHHRSIPASREKNAQILTRRVQRVRTEENPRNHHPHIDRQHGKRRGQPPRSPPREETRAQPAARQIERVKGTPDDKRPGRAMPKPRDQNTIQRLRKCLMGVTRLPPSGIYR